MSLILIWLLLFSGLSVSHAQNDLPTPIQNLVNIILKNTSDRVNQILLVHLLRSFRRSLVFENIVFRVANLFYPDPMRMDELHYHMYVGNLLNETVFFDSNVTDITVPDKTAKFVVLFHGYTSSRTFMPDAGITKLLNKGYIVISTQYTSHVNDPIYIFPALRSFLLGNKIGKTLKALGIPESQMTFVGFSLGGHIAAATSDYLSHQCNNKCKVDKIFGLDTAGPSIRIYIIPLSKESANYVVSFHTSFTGEVSPMGHVDYYAIDLGETCANKFGKNTHEVAVDYFVNSIDDPELYKVSNCDLLSLWIILRDWFKILTLRNSEAQLAYMNFNTRTSVEGIYCFNLKEDSKECTKNY